MGKGAKLKWITIALAGLSIAAAGQVSAADAVKKTTNGGNKIWGDGNQCLKFSGRMHNDVALFMGSSKDEEAEFANGTNLRRFNTYFSGMLNKDLGYLMGISFKPGNEIGIDEANISYKFNDNLTFNVGQSAGAIWGLENSSYSDDLILMEYGLTSTWAPTHSIGLRTNFTTDDFSLNVEVSAPSANSKEENGSDKIGYYGRVAYSPFRNMNAIYHLGASYYMKNLRWSVGDTLQNTIDLKASVGIQGRDTGNLISLSNPAQRSSAWELDASVAMYSGLVTAEYTQVEYSRGKDSKWTGQTGDVKFRSWAATGSYLLTGEMPNYNMSSGSWMSPTPNSTCGAWQVVTRYEYLDLNSRELAGGGMHQVSFGVNWILSKNLHLKLAYSKATSRKHTTATDKASKRTINALGFRMLVKF